MLIGWLLRTRRVALFAGGGAGEETPLPSGTVGQPIGLLLALTYAT